jgi:hypothetical protein
MKFELTTDNFEVVYKRQGVQSSVEIAFFKLRVKELLKEDRIPIINDFQLLKMKEDTVRTGRDRKILKMRMAAGTKSHLELVFE